MPARACLIAILIAALTARVSMAELLIYEGFNGYATGAGGLNSVKPNANTIGLDQTVNFGGTGPAAMTVSASSVGFSANFLTTGGSVSMTGTGAAVLAAPIDLLGPTPTGTLYASYLVNLGGHGAASGDGTHTRIGSDTGTGNSHFQTYADSRSGSTATAIAYGTTIVNGAETLTSGTSYLMISSFTNMNTALSGTVTGIGRTYALTAAQYDSFLAAGAMESYLTSTAIGTAANQITSRVTSGTATSGTFSLVDGNFAHFVTVGHTLSLDEMRYGTALADVVAAIPEPSTIVMSVLGIAFLASRRFRQAA
jgi:hypothetical protein